jgi:hypothetical protein
MITCYAGHAWQIVEDSEVFSAVKIRLACERQTKAFNKKMTLKWAFARGAIFVFAWLCLLLHVLFLGTVKNAYARTVSTWGQCQCVWQGNLASAKYSKVSEVQALFLHSMRCSLCLAAVFSQVSHVCSVAAWQVEEVPFF